MNTRFFRFSRPSPVTVLTCILVVCSHVLPTQAQQTRTKRSQPKSQPTPAATPTASPTVNPSPSPAKMEPEEVDFVKTAGADNIATVRFANLALQNAKSQRVRDFANVILKEGTQLNNDLNLLAKPQSISFSSVPGPAAESSYEHLKALHDQAFDSAYITSMVEEHTRLVGEYKRMQGAVKDQKLKVYLDQATPLLIKRLQSATDLQANVSGAANP